LQEVILEKLTPVSQVNNELDAPASTILFSFQRLNRPICNKLSLSPAGKFFFAPTIPFRN
jgi:hypothetical protein